MYMWFQEKNYFRWTFDFNFKFIVRKLLQIIIVLKFWIFLVKLLIKLSRPLYVYIER